MNRLKSSALAVLAVAVMAGLAMLYVEPVDAQTSAALSIPPRKNYTVEPGNTTEDTLLVRNIDSERPLNLSLRIVDFSDNGDDGTPKLMLAEDAPQTTWSLKPFMEVPQSVTIGPGESVSIPVKVSIPEGHGAGDYYSAIVYSSGASEGGNVGLSASGVSLVFVTIPGEVDEKLTLQRIGPFTRDEETNEVRYKYFTMDMPQRLAYTIKNEGNVTGSPVGSMTLRNIFGKETTINDINPQRSLALIGQTRAFEACIRMAKEEVDFNGTRQEETLCSSPSLWPGFYKIEFEGFYGRNGNNTQELSGSGWFIYAPWWSIVIFVVLLAYVSYQVWKLINFIKLKQNRGIKTKKRAPRGKK